MSGDGSASANLDSRVGDLEVEASAYRTQAAKTESRLTHCEAARCMLMTHADDLLCA